MQIQNAPKTGSQTYNPVHQQPAIDCPNEVKRILAPGEQIMAVVQQSRLKATITPDSIVVTHERIILCKPSTLGLKKQVEDFRYHDMANFKVEKGILCGSIIIRQNFMSDDVVIDNLPKDQLDKVMKIVQEKIRLARTPHPITQTSASSQSQDPLTLLKTRFVKGEITQDQFEEMKRLLE